MVGYQQRRHRGLPHADPDPEAGDAGLGDLEHRLPDLIPITDAHLGVGEALDGEVLAELPVGEVVPV